jgi:hypothetical protein
LAEQQRRIHELESRAEQAGHEEPRRQEEAHRQEEPHQEQPRYEPPAPAPVEQPRAEQPRVDPKELLKDAGLVMIETDRAKAQVQPPVHEEPQNLGRPRRERVKPLPQDDELQQVETKR